MWACFFSRALNLQILSSPRTSFLWKLLCKAAMDVLSRTTAGWSFEMKCIKGVPFIRSCNAGTHRRIQITYHAVYHSLVRERNREKDEQEREMSNEKQQVMRKDKTRTTHENTLGGKKFVLHAFFVVEVTRTKEYSFYFKSVSGTSRHMNSLRRDGERNIVSVQRRGYKRRRKTETHRQI